MRVVGASYKATDDGKHRQSAELPNPGLYFWFVLKSHIDMKSPGRPEGVDRSQSCWDNVGPSGPTSKASIALSGREPGYWGKGLSSTPSSCMATAIHSIPIDSPVR